MAAEKDIENRVTVVETQLAALSLAVRDVNDTVKRQGEIMSQGFKELHDVILAMNKVQSDRDTEREAKRVELGRTPWGVLSSWAGVIVIVLGTVGTLAIQPLRAKNEDNRTSIRKLWRAYDRVSEREIKNAEQRGHQRAMLEHLKGGR